MWPYIIPLFLTILSIILYDFNNHKGKGAMYFCIYLYLVFLIGLRYEVGGDTINYMGYFSWQDDLDNFTFSFGEQFQPGYNFLVAVSKSISPQFYVFQFIHSVIINSLLFIFIRNNTKYIFSALLCLYFVAYLYFTCEILRESISILIFAFLYKPLLQNRWVVYFSGVAVCVLFHLSSIILLIFPFLTSLKFDKKYLVILCIAAICMLFLNRLLNGVTELIFIGDKLAAYSGESHGYLADLLFSLRKGIFPIVFSIIIKFGCRKVLPFENQLAILGLFGVMAFFNPVIFGRITNYVIIFFILSFSSEMINFFKSHKKNLIHNAAVLCILFTFVYGSGFTMYNIYKLYIPYSSNINPVSYNRNIFNK